jgi:ABC-type Mn2+/Zn2+ transport system permease subunit
MLTDRFARMLWLSSGIGAACGFVGMNLSYHLDVPSGTTIVLTGAAVFTVVLMVTGGRGLRRTAMMDSHAEPTPAPAAVAR